jgi:hypothetical protein
MSSKRPLAYSMMWEWLRPSSLIRAMAARSRFSTAGWEAAGAAFGFSAAYAHREIISRTIAIFMVVDDTRGDFGQQTLDGTRL